MTLHLAYTGGLALALVVAQLVVMMGGVMPSWAWLAVPAPLCLPWLAARGRGLGVPAATALALGGLVLGVTVLAGRGVEAAVLAAAQTLVVILVARVLSRQTLVHDLQALLLSLLLVLAGAALNLGISYGVGVVVYALLGVWALLARQLVAGAELEAARPGGAALQVTLARRDVATPAFAVAVLGLSVAILAGTAVLFAVFPRVGWARLAFLSRAATSFPTSVGLSDAPRAALGGRVLARVRGLEETDFDAGLYLRGAVYERLTAKGFERAPMTEAPPSRLQVAAGGPVRRYEVFQQPVLGDVLLTLGPVRRAHIVGGGTENPSFRLRVAGASPSGELLASAALSGAVRVDVEGTLVRPGMALDAVPIMDDERTRAVEAHHLQLPALDPRVAALARTLSVGLTDDAARVQAVRRHLGDGFRYALDGGNGAAPDPLSSFLFETRAGHCEYFATAMTALLRAAGVPARVVGGFQGGIWDADANLVVFTGGHAHAWTEWFDPAVGWVTEDATPASLAPRVRFGAWAALLESARRGWDDWILDYGIQQQLDLVADVMAVARSPRLRLRLPGRGVLVGVLLAGMAVGGAWWFRRRPRRAGGENRLARALTLACGRTLGRPVPPTWTLREAVSACGENDAMASLRRALDLYERTRFGGEGVERRTLQATLRALRRLRAPAVPRG